MFRGINEVVLDVKGRIKLPARYQRLLPKESQSDKESNKEKEPQLVLTIDTESPCLLLYPVAEWEIIEEKLQSLPSFNPAVRRIQRLLIGHATDLALDTNGRILLPLPLRNYAHLKEKIMVVGQGKKIELWGSSEWSDYRTQWINEIVKPEDLPDELQTLVL